MKKESSNLAIVETWTMHYIKCSFTNRTPDFVNNVLNFYDALLDLDEDKKAIATKVNNYYENTYLPELKKEIEEQTYHTTDESTIESHRTQIENGYIRKLFKFIIQTIQKSGVGWQLRGSGKGYYVGADNVDEFIGESR